MTPKNYGTSKCCRMPSGYPHATDCPNNDYRYVVSCSWDGATTASFVDPKDSIQPMHKIVGRDMVTGTWVEWKLESWPFRENNILRSTYFAYQGIPFLRNYRWYRKLIGGKWVQVGLIWDKRWVHVSDGCVERVDEDWG